MQPAATMRNGRYQIGYGGQLGPRQHIPECKAPHPFAVVECTCPASATLGLDTPIEKLSMMQYDMMYDKAPLPEHKILAIRTRLRRLYPDDPRYARLPGEEDFVPRMRERAYRPNIDTHPDLFLPGHQNQQTGVGEQLPTIPQAVLEQVYQNPEMFASDSERVLEQQGYYDPLDPYAEQSARFQAWRNSISREEYEAWESTPEKFWEDKPKAMQNNPNYHNKPDRYQPPQPPQQDYFPGQPVLPTGYPPNTPPSLVPPILTAAERACRSPHILEFPGGMLITVECGITEAPHPGIPHTADMPSRMKGIDCRIYWMEKTRG